MNNLTSCVLTAVVIFMFTVFLANSTQKRQVERFLEQGLSLQQYYNIRVK